jgi:hypothetical protein
MRITFISKICLIFSLLVASNVFAITIINENSKNVNYTINDAVTCGGLEYNKGQLSAGGMVQWTSTIFYHPSSVCVHAMGMSSTTGAYAFNVKNDTCVLKIVDAGFMRGIKIKTVNGC